MIQSDPPPGVAFVYLCRSSSCSSSCQEQQTLPETTLWAQYSLQCNTARQQNNHWLPDWHNYRNIRYLLRLSQADRAYRLDICFTSMVYVLLYYTLYSVGGEDWGVYWSVHTAQWKLNPYFKLNLSKLSKYSYLIMMELQKPWIVPAQTKQLPIW